MERSQFHHRLLTWFVFLISFFIYYLTIAPTTSFWDCGEFIACSHILGIPHPPGAPFYLLLGRIFSIIPWAADIGLRVNIISALTSAFTIMLTHLIIFRLLKIFRGSPDNFEDRVILYSGSIIGALAFAFSDSLWFSAVEAEVYAISMFFTALIVWLILVWYEKADEPSSDRYLVLIAYCVGLTIGIHLLSILALPTIFLIYYFRKHKFDILKFLLFILISAISFFSIYPGIVKKLPNLALIVINSFGASIGIYLLISVVVLFFAALISAILSRSRVLTFVLISLLMILVGASTFTGVYLRSQLNPAIDENNPEDLKKFVSYINRDQYGHWDYIQRRANLWDYQIKKMYLRYLGWNYFGKGTLKDAQGLLAETLNFRGLWGIPFLVGLFGMVFHFIKDHRRALTILILFLMTGLAIVLYLNQPNPQPRERDYVYLGSFFAFALWIGIGISGILDLINQYFVKPKQGSKLQLLLLSLLLFILIPVKMLAFNFHSHNRTGNYVAYDYSYNLLQSCEPNAIIFTNGDNDTFPLWFLQYVNQIRTDVRVVNLSLLNTPWYVYQLRDKEPRLPIHMKDREIDKLAPSYWPTKKTLQIMVPKEVFQNELKDLEQRKEFTSKLNGIQPAITFELGPTWMGQAIRAQDIMILNIIASNQFRKPIYFAITVPRENLVNLGDYLRMDGLAYKLVTYPGNQISPSRLKENLMEKFQYRNLDNPDVYYNDNILGLLTNYRSAFLKLANFYRQEKMYDLMFEVLDKMESSIPEHVIPLFDRRLSMGIGSMYLDGGRPQEFTRRLDQLLNTSSLSNSEKLEIAQIYYQYLNQPTRSEAIVRELLQTNPRFKNGYYWLYQLYSDIKEFNKGLQLATKMLELFPNDEQALARKKQFENFLSK